MREIWEVPNDSQKHLIVGRIIEIVRNAEDQTSLLDICVEERRTINNEEIVIYEMFSVKITIYQEKELSAKLNIGQKVECRYFTFDKLNYCTYLVIVDKDFIPAELKEKQRIEARRLRSAIKTQDKQERKIIYDFES